MLPEEQTYQAKLRNAVFDAISESDVSDVVKQIVGKAKEGDTKAQKMFFDYLLGAKNRPAQVVVNNTFTSVEDAAKLRREG